MANPNNIKNALSRKEAVFGLVSIVVFVVFALQFSKSWQFETEHPLNGKSAPEIEYTMENGRATSISKQKGSTVMLNFWASWCAPCMSEMPSLLALENHFSQKGLVLLVFNIEDLPGETVAGRIAGSKMPKNLIFNFSKESLRPYDVKNIPLSVLIDKRGIVRKVYSGPREWMRFETIHEIETVLNN